MHLTIFNVEHGFCAYAIASNGKVLMIDCGRNETTGFSPAQHLFRQGRQLELLIITHYDEDHIADLPHLWRLTYPLRPIHLFAFNSSLSSADLRRIKLRESGQISPAIATMIEVINSTGPRLERPDFPDIAVEFFHNNYPEFNDTNNLSVVTFVDSGDVHLVFPGDLERAGWLRLLDDPDFRGRLAMVNYFVTSHHGRENGYCREVFQYCHPAAFIISDTAIQYQSQMHNLYAQHASGVLQPDRSRRYVWTTRSGQPITFDTGPVAPGPYIDYTTIF